MTGIMNEGTNSLDRRLSVLLQSELGKRRHHNPLLQQKHP